MSFQTNPELDLAHEFVRFTDRNVFLTGKAGTGKTTFLHNLKETLPKRMIVVAPTGVAAINAGGVTIHSFFQLPFGPIFPGATGGEDNKKHRFNRQKIDIIRTLDLLVIDEVSMVRSDLLDGIDEVLRRYRRNQQPFGGVQLLMIGDLQQLAPVIRDDEWSLLRPYYDSAFFFGSRALKQTDYVSIELKQIFRQQDDAFIDVLNKIRDNRLDRKGLDILNCCHRPEVFKNDGEGYITLTTHNAQAKRINDARLKKLPGSPHTFSAQIDGNFPENNYPTDGELVLKEGAQVMFVKNDPSSEKRYYNGKIGQVTGFDESVIFVKCPGDEEAIRVKPEQWTNARYKIDQQTKEIREEVEGTFIQFPLKTAWAITIHKSQGLTFEKAIIDANAAFAHG
ncbi:MAG: ATP-dependent DNA helicase, partial [Bacteroidota bacterium]